MGRILDPETDALRERPACSPCSLGGAGPGDGAGCAWSRPTEWDSRDSAEGRSDDTEDAGEAELLLCLIDASGTVGAVPDALER